MSKLAKALMQGAAGSSEPVYVDDVFSTYLYTGTGSAQTITNNIDLSTKGGLVWLKSRSSVTDHCLIDTAQGRSKELYSNLTNAADTLSSTNGITAFNTTGFSLGTNWGGENPSGASMVSWTFRKQAKFFDVVTYTGNGSQRNISHNLGSAPGCIIVKDLTSGSNNWCVYHISNFASRVMFLNTTAARTTSANYWANIEPTSTEFTVGVGSAVNTNGNNYVAYLFANDAGGFGAAGTDNVISCGSYSGNGSATGPTIALGYEPQWLLVKDVSVGNDWMLVDNMRRFDYFSIPLMPNLSLDESYYGANPFVTPTATGFNVITTNSNFNASGHSYIYIAIRRPMKPPTSGTEVFIPTTYTGTGSAQTITTNFPVDTVINHGRTATWGVKAMTRLMGINTDQGGSIKALFPNSTSVESTETQYITKATNTTYTLGTDAGINESSKTFVNWNFKRAPGFHDVVCYTGTGSALTLSHNLTVAPELIIAKRRSGASQSWYVTANFTDSYYPYLNLEKTDAALPAGYSNSDVHTAKPTSTQITFGQYYNTSGAAYVAYLFATLPGVSKVGSYTGNGTSQTINCGFSGGARFVMIKRTDSTGDWYVWDTARGIAAGNDPYLLLNSTAAEDTSTDYIDPYSAGFEISSTAPAAINANGGSYIYLAIA